MFDLFGRNRWFIHRSEYNTDCSLGSTDSSPGEEAIGFCSTLDRFENDLKRYATHDTTSAVKAGPRDEITLGGVVVAMRERPFAVVMVAWHLSRSKTYKAKLRPSF